MNFAVLIIAGLEEPINTVLNLFMLGQWQKYGLGIFF